MKKRLTALSLAALMLVAASGSLFGAFAQGEEEQTFTVAGRILDSAEPPAGIAGAAVKLSGDELDGDTTVTTGENGAFAIAGVPAGSYTISVTADGFEDADTLFALAGDIDDFEIALAATSVVPPPAFTVSGKIVDGKNANIGAAVVKILKDTEVVKTVTTPATGVFTFAEIMADTYKINVTADGFNAIDTSLTVSANVADFVITLSLAVPELKVTAPANIVYGTALADPAIECKNCGDDPVITVYYTGMLFIDSTKVDSTGDKPALPGIYVVTASAVIGVDDDDEEIVLADTASFRIGRKTLEWTGGKVFDKVYDGTTVAEIDSTAPATTLTGVLPADAELVPIDDDNMTRGVTVSVTNGAVAFADANVGSDIGITASGFSAGLGGPRAWRYMVPVDTAGNIIQPIFAAAAISKAEIESGVDQTLFVLADTAREYTFNLARLQPSVAPREFGDVTYEIVSEINEDSVLDSVPAVGAVLSPLTLKVAKAEDGDSAAITIKVSSRNFEDFTAVLTVAVVDKDPVTISAVMKGGVYNGNPFAFDSVAVTDANDSTVSVSLVALYESTDDGGYNSAEPPISAGAYRLTLSVPDNNASYIGSAQFTFAIEKMAVTVTANNITLDVGSPAPPTDSLTYTVSTMVGADSLTTKPTRTVTPDMNVAGVYPINIYGAAASANYELRYVGGILTVKDTVPIAVKEAAREIADAAAVKEAAAVAPLKILASEFTAGPNPVGKTGAVNFFRAGGRIQSGSLTVYNASGAVVARIRVSDRAAGNDRRQIASWDLKDVRGRAVSEGAYLVRGTVKTADGKRENVSMMIGVR